MQLTQLVKRNTFNIWIVFSISKDFEKGFIDIAKRVPPLNASRVIWKLFIVEELLYSPKNAKIKRTKYLNKKLSKHTIFLVL